MRWSEDEKDTLIANAINVLVCAPSPEEFNRVSNYKIDKEI